MSRAGHGGTCLYFWGGWEGKIEDFWGSGEKRRARKMAQQLKAFATKPDTLSSIPRTQFWRVVFWHSHCDTHTPSHSQSISQSTNQSINYTKVEERKNKALCTGPPTLQRNCHESQKHSKPNADLQLYTPLCRTLPTPHLCALRGSMCTAILVFLYFSVSLCGCLRMTVYVTYPYTVIHQLWEFLGFVFLLFCSFWRQGLRQPRLFLNSLCTWGWPSISDPPAAGVTSMSRHTGIFFNVVLWLKPRAACVIGKYNTK